MTKVRSIKNKELAIYISIIALTALGLALSNEVISNYFKDAYNVTAYQRGVIELPREFPGVICMFIIAGLSFLPDIKISIIAQVLSVIGITVLGFFTPSFGVMLIFIFINSLGMHLFMPLQDSIGISLIKDGKIGKRMGQYKGISTAFTMTGGIIVFVGFRTGFFSFTTPVKWIFVISGIILFCVLILMIVLNNITKTNIDKKEDKKIRLVFRKKYKYYYILVIMFGLQKQMMLVYGPWVLIDLLGKKPDTMAILGIAGSFIGMFFIPALGRWLDRFGIKTMLYLDAISYIGVYLLYGIICAGFDSGFLAKVGLPVLIVYIIVIFDKMSMQMGMVRTIYLKSILVHEADFTRTLSLGLSLDHVVSITCAYLGGVVWSFFGPQYVFFLVAGLSFVNLHVAKKV